VNERVDDGAEALEGDTERWIFRADWPKRVEREEAAPEIGAAAIATLVESQRLEW
jgi:hypothetical protein